MQIIIGTNRPMTAPIKIGGLGLSMKVLSYIYIKKWSSEPTLQKQGRTEKPN